MPITNDQWQRLKQQDMQLFKTLQEHKKVFGKPESADLFKKQPKNLGDTYDQVNKDYSLEYRAPFISYKSRSIK